MTVPHYVVEGAYARLFSADNTVAATGVQFGPRYRSVPELSPAELSLPPSFDATPCGLDEYVRRVAREAVRADRAPLVARAVAFESAELFAPHNSANECRLSELLVSTLTYTRLLSPSRGR